MGPVGLHGGGEYLAGDEPFMRLLLDAAARSADVRAAACGGTSDGSDRETVRIAILPTAAARQRPDLAGRTGRDAFERLAGGDRRRIRVDVVQVVDEATAADPRHAAILAAADLIHLPGGDPDLVPAILRDSSAWRAVLAARARGAVLAGASAGAMALAEWTWTPGGPIPALGVVRGLVVVPHFGGAAHGRWEAAYAEVADRGLGLLGLDDRTGVLAETDGAPGRWRWRVAGEGAATWIPCGSPGGARDVAADGGELLPIGATVTLGA